ncbi:protein kinase [Streptomyces sp. NPDC127038]|uniref:serine/threonine-protein kinase n=1 Tax=Streptomyces sp. NPDC127038 TaxID=3347114 RepID=UPI003665C04A
MNRTRPTDIDTGTLLADRYRLNRLIGKGGQGLVFTAEDENLGGRTVAVKILLPLSGQAAQRQQEALARFDREVNALARLTHDNIVVIHDRLIHQGVPFSVMEFLEGPNLADRLRSEHQLPLSDALSWTAEAADALTAAHALGIWHRDVKPANIQLTRTGRAKLCDFGLVSALTPNDPTLTRRGHAAGCTPGYASPEQAEGRLVAGPSDVFSLGVTLYALLAGGTPFGAADPTVALLRAIEEYPSPVTVHRPDAPAEVAQLLALMMEKDPAARPSAHSVAVRLRRCLERLRAAGEDGTHYTPTVTDAPVPPAVDRLAAAPAQDAGLGAEQDVVTGAGMTPVPDQGGPVRGPASHGPAGENDAAESHAADDAEELWRALETAEGQLLADRFSAADAGFRRLSKRLYEQGRHRHPAMVAAQLGRVRALSGLGRAEEAGRRLAGLRSTVGQKLDPSHPLRTAVEGLRLEETPENRAARRS